MWRKREHLPMVHVHRGGVGMGERAPTMVHVHRAGCVWRKRERQREVRTSLMSRRKSKRFADSQQCDQEPVLQTFYSINFMLCKFLSILIG